MGISISGFPTRITTIADCFPLRTRVIGFHVPLDPRVSVSRKSSALTCTSPFPLPPEQHRGYPASLQLAHVFFPLSRLGLGTARLHHVPRAPPYFYGIYCKEDDSSVLKRHLSRYSLFTLLHPDQPHCLADTGNFFKAIVRHFGSEGLFILRIKSFSLS